jgi:hypothetical protein
VGNRALVFSKEVAMSGWKLRLVSVGLLCLLWPVVAGGVKAPFQRADELKGSSKPAVQPTGTGPVLEAAPAKSTSPNDSKSENPTSQGNSTSQTTQNQNPSRWARALKQLELLKPAADTVKGAAEVLAYIAALLFFFFKVRGGGYLTANLALTVECRRQKSASSNWLDDLCVVATVKRGGNRTIKLLYGAVRTETLQSHMTTAKELQFKRVDYDRDRILSGRRPSVSWDFDHPRYPFLFMPPGDESQFACHFMVPRAEPCQIDVLVFGRSKSFKIKVSQWRASDISLPLDQE